MFKIQSFRVHQPFKLGSDEICHRVIALAILSNNAKMEDGEAIN